MAGSEYEVVIVGGGAAGVAAAHRLHAAGVDCLLVEARSRLGGRAFTDTVTGFPLDLGCGWLHSADRNPWAEIARAQGRTIDKTPPPWSGRRSLNIKFPPEEQKAYRAAMAAFFERVSAAAKRPDRPAAELLTPGDRWNGLIRAVATYISGAELERVSTHDLENYDDTQENWRVVEGYGTTVAAHAANAPVKLNCPVRAIDHSGKRVAVDTAQGTLSAERVIVTLPSTVLGEETVRFFPALPDKVEAARGLPLGLADKLFLALDRAEEFESESRLFGHTDRSATATYHFRPFGRPLIEVYFGGDHAWHLEQGGEKAFFDFAASELADLLGRDFVKRIKPAQMHLWGSDPFARGSYSSALPGQAGCRPALAAPVDNRLFFAGEATSVHDYSTAHGAYNTGLRAADEMLAARARKK